MGNILTTISEIDKIDKDRCAQEFQNCTHDLGLAGVPIRLYTNLLLGLPQNHSDYMLVIDIKVARHCISLLGNRLQIIVLQRSKYHQYLHL